MKLGIAAIFKNEKPYIIEWLAYHRLMGFDKFFIADNISDDGSTELLKSLHNAGLITRLEFPTVDGKGPQMPAYNKMLKKYGSKVDLLTFIDADEFIVPAEGMSVRPFLKPLVEDEQVGAIALNWAIYGSSGHIEYVDRPVIERFTKRSRQSSGTNRHIKTLLKPGYCERMLTSHKVQLNKGQYVKANGNTFDFFDKNIHGCSEAVDWAPLRINHYVIKSFDEFKNRKQRRPRASINEFRRDSFFKAHDMNHETCEEMARFLEPVRLEMQVIEYQLHLAEYNKNARAKPNSKSKLIKKTGLIGRWIDHKLQYAMLPCSDIRPAENDFTWEAIGSDPGFMLKRQGALPKGWYMLSVKVKSNRSRLNGKLYVNYGSGMSEETAINVPLKNGTLVKKICYFPQVAKSLRFDPTEEPCLFDIAKFEFSKLTPGYARKLLNKKISHHLGQGVGKALENKLLLEKYDLCFHGEGNLATYQDWLQLNDNKTSDAEVVRKKRAGIKKKIKFNLVVIASGSEETLASSFDVLARQSYKEFQVSILYLADIKSQLKNALSALDHSSIEYKLHEIKGGADLFEGLNVGLDCTKGDYLTIIDARDTLSQHALLYLAEAIDQTADSKIIYSDEDLVDKNGERSEPNFKPELNPDLLYSQDYISNFVTFSAELLRTIGGFRSGLADSCVYDAVLRSSALVRKEQVIRIPHILNHKAKDKECLFSQSDVVSAGLKVRQDYFSTQNQAVNVSYQQESDNYRVQWPIPEQLPLVSLLIPTRDGYDILKQCIDSILEKTTYPNYEIIVLNNQSQCTKTLGYFDQISLHEHVRILPFDRSFNYSAINNLGVRHARGSVIGLINNDIEVISEDWLTEMVSHAMRPDVGCVGAKLYYANDTIQHAGVICGLGGVAGHSHKHYKRSDAGFHNRLNCVQTLSAVTAAVLLMRKKVFQEVGGLDEENLVVALNDVDLCLKVREAGYRNIWTPYAELYHHESISRGLDDTPEKKARFVSEHTFMREKWKGKLYPDPYYNPNLTQTREDFSLNF